ncbi:MAG TPA: hemerythrin domain-containing protein [Marmoricola sp.]|nr:hemerythrin domain-containing protein [Marmoricola sp.]
MTHNDPSLSSSAPTEPQAGTRTLAGALEREHREIDGGIEAFVAGTGGAAAAVEHLRTALAALRRHIYLEEEFLFPPLRAAGLLGPIMVMLLEHGELWRTMDGLEQSLVDGDPDVQRATCTALLAALENHNGKEEQILYSQADTVLSEDASAELRDFMANEELPAGWVCQRA